MNVWVVVPRALRPAVDGRRKLDLGVPPSADVGDLLHTLFSLYPKLRRHIPNDNKPVRQQFNVLLTEQSGRELAARRSGLREGSTVYLSASIPPEARGRGKTAG